MDWIFTQKGNRFTLSKNCINDGFVQQQIDKLKEDLQKRSDPVTHPQHVGCPTHNRHVVPVPETDYFLAFILHNNTDPDPEQRHTIELVKVFHKDDIANQARY